MPHPPSNKIFELSSPADGTDLGVFIGCILWLKPASQVPHYASYGLNEEACNHPCLVVDISLSEGQIHKASICIVSGVRPAFLFHADV